MWTPLLDLSPIMVFGLIEIQRHLKGVESAIDFSRILCRDYFLLALHL
jgi:hypothetical protein